jgi:phospholipid-transporting ATPase
LDLSK